VALALVAGFGIYLVFMRSWADDLVPIGAAGANGAMHLAWVLALKLATMVALPFLLMNSLFHVRLKDFGLSIEGLRRLAGRDGLTVLVLSAALCGFQYLAGSAAAPFREGRYPSEALQVGLPFAFAWLVLEVGLTEEFLFRGLLQHRLSAFLRSDVAGMLLMAIVFGLVHAPGIVLRGAGVAEGLGEHPDVLTAMAYTIAVQSVVAILFAVVWMRTRNLAVVILIHAATDLLSNATEVMSAFGFVTLAP
jgi:membrane protease YdiL (CAAX protease family)